MLFRSSVRMDVRRIETLKDGQDAVGNRTRVKVVKNKMATFSESSKGSDITWEDVPADLQDQRDEMYEAILEAASDFDDEFAERYLEGEELSEAEVKAAIRKGVVQQEVTPMFCGTAFKNKGVQLLLDAVVDYLPSPLDVPAIEGTDVDDEEKVVVRKSEDSEPLAALAFKIMTDPFVGTLSFVRVYSGVLESGSYVYNPRKRSRDRISRIVQMHANKREEVAQARAGDIVAVVGLKDVYTGDTLCDEKQPVMLETISAPDPVISVAIEPKTKGDQEKLSLAIQKLAEEDPTFRVMKIGRAHV